MLCREIRSCCYGIGFGPVSDGTAAGVIDQNTNQVNASVDIYHRRDVRASAIRGIDARGGWALSV